MIWLINWKVFFYILLSLKCGYIIQLTIYKIASLHSLTGRFCFVFSLVGVVGRILKKTPCCDPCPCIVGCGWNLCIRWHVPVVTESHSTAKGGFPGGLIHTQQPLEFSQLMRRRKSQKLVGYSAFHFANQFFNNEIKNLLLFWIFKCLWKTDFLCIWKFDFITKICTLWTNVIEYLYFLMR